jgi:hypothetical protein
VAIRSAARGVAILLDDRDYRRFSVRNALILLAVVALLLLVAGAVNNGVAFDVDYVAGTVQAVSLFWVSAVVAAVVFVVGLIAAWLAQAAMVGSRRKLEAELQSTYERLREAESLAVRPAPEAAVVDAHVAETVVVADQATVVAREDATVVQGEAATIVDSSETATAVADEAVVVEHEAATATGEATAVTVAGQAGSGEARPPATDSADGAPDEAAPDDGA